MTYYTSLGLNIMHFKPIRKNSNQRIITFNHFYFALGRLCRFSIGALMAFLSGLTITLNNFVVKATRVNFGEILAIRCIVQISCMLPYILIRGMYHRKYFIDSKKCYCELYLAGTSEFVIVIFSL